jgi:steroid delta-isomerase-like uncharacterized protein
VFAVSAEENVAIARRWITAWEDADEAAMDELYAPNFIYHNTFPPLQPGLAGEKQFVHILHAGFPDLRIIIGDIIAAEGSAVIRWTMPGTHQGMFRGTPPTGKVVEFRGIDILGIEGGKIVARWDAVERPAL